MSQTRMLLHVYYEVLYERLEARRHLCTDRIEKLLRDEIARRRFGEFDAEKFAAYQEACLAFVTERIETYNPIGVQYIFDRTSVKEAFELELALNWYGGREEFAGLVEAARRKAAAKISEERRRELADELIRELGAYPDKSIISGYEAEPALIKLPDYVVARVIEEIIR